jgi:hypothetical protein
MRHTAAGVRAIAIDIRDAQDALLGVALLVPSARYAAVLATNAERPTEPVLSGDVWEQIESWTAAADAGLPARPAPMSPAVAGAMLETDRQTAIARRFASIPIDDHKPEDLTLLAARALPGFLVARRSVA